MGVCRLNGQLYLVDRTGTLIDEFGPQYADLDLPIIDGLATSPRDGGMRASRMTALAGVWWSRDTTFCRQTRSKRTF